MTSSASRPPHQPHALSLKTAYLYCIFGGVLGLHRFYLRRPISATLYLLTFGFLTLGVVTDLIMLAWLTRRSRDQLARETADDERGEGGAEERSVYEEHEHPTPVYTPEELDPFKSIFGSSSSRRDAQHIISLITSLVMISLIAIYGFDDWLLALVSLLFMVSLTSAHAMKRLTMAPLIGPLMMSFYRNYLLLEAHYQRHLPPRFSIPVLSLIWRLLTKRGRQEFRLYKGLASFGAIVIALNWLDLIREYYIDYYPYLGVSDLLATKITYALVNFILGALFVFILVIPVTRKLVYAKLAQRDGQVRFITLSAVLISGLVLAVAHDPYSYSIEDAGRLRSLYKSSAFRAQISRAMDTWMSEAAREMIYMSSSTPTPESPASTPAGAAHQRHQEMCHRALTKAGVHLDSDQSGALRARLREALTAEGFRPSLIGQLRVKVFHSGPAPRLGAPSPSNNLVIIYANKLIISETAHFYEITPTFTVETRAPEALEALIDAVRDGC